MTARRSHRLVGCAGLVALGLLSGCTSLSGLGGNSQYACGAPEGVSCQSVSATYAQGPRGAKEGAAAPASGAAVPTDFKTVQRAPSAGTAAPLRTPPRILRLWFKPWEDADRDLVDQGYVYVQVDPGGWQLESWQRQVREPYRPLRAPRPVLGASEAALPAEPSPAQGMVPATQAAPLTHTTPQRP